MTYGSGSRLDQGETLPGVVVTLLFQRARQPHVVALDTRSAQHGAGCREARKSRNLWMAQPRHTAVQRE